MGREFLFPSLQGHVLCDNNTSIDKHMAIPPALAEQQAGMVYFVSTILH
jgi:hypothetical protein